DQRLWRQDVQAAEAWAGALRRAGILTDLEAADLRRGLGQVAERLTNGAADHAPDEDVHSLVERLLYEEVGTVAGKLNTGRSRNDQVVTDLRLWLRDALAAVDAEVAALGRTLGGRAAEGIDLILPGYTHGQRAQPVRWAYVLLAHAWPLARDRERLVAVATHLEECPLGSGAVAGSGVAIDRDALAAELGFRRPSPNALDVTGDRDFVVEALAALALVGAHLSRLGGELMVYASSEVGFVRLADAYCTGSSLLPQKRNPDVFELARAKAGRILGDLTAMLATLRGLPAGYSKDLQEDKGWLFDAVDTVLLTLPAVRGALETLTPRGDRMEAALDDGLLATDVADGLVRQGVPFREAHGLVGRLVREAERDGVVLPAVAAARAAAIHPALPAVLAELGTWEDSVERRGTMGGSSRAAVARQLEALARAFAAPWPRSHVP
ncbi:MAG: argininosuccinate lyase, partial [Gemmatimonadota bacterium]|nr:argininosuccinate lyase [Gemmatimonadota bacterium]